MKNVFFLIILILIRFKSSSSCDCCESDCTRNGCSTNGIYCKASVTTGSYGCCCYLGFSGSTCISGLLYGE